MPQCARLVNLFSPRFTVTIIIMVVLCGLWALQLRPSSFVPPVKPADITSRSKSPRDDKQPNSPHFHARVSEAEAKNNHPGPIQIAFLLLIHDKNGAKLAARSINRLFSPRHTFVVHIDKKADFDSLTTILLENFEQNSVTKALSTNILVMSSASVRWGSGTILRVELDMLQYALERREFDYAVMMSGACYPIQPLARIESILSTMRGDGAKQQSVASKLSTYESNRIRTTTGSLTKLQAPRLPLRRDGSAWPRADPHLDPVSNAVRFEDYWGGVDLPWMNIMNFDGTGGYFSPRKRAKFVNRHMIRLIQRERDVNEFEWRFGSQWFILSRPFVEFALYSSTSRAIFDIMASSLASDETFFPSIAWNSGWRSHSIWTEPGRRQQLRAILPQRLERWVGGPHPANTTMKDVEDIIGKGSYRRGSDESTRIPTLNALFLRKINIETDESIVQAIDEHVLGTPHVLKIQL